MPPASYSFQSHGARDVLQEHESDAALTRTGTDEVRALLRAPRQRARRCWRGSRPGSPAPMCAGRGRSVSPSRNALNSSKRLPSRRRVRSPRARPCACGGQGIEPRHRGRRPATGGLRTGAHPRQVSRAHVRVRDDAARDRERVLVARQLMVGDAQAAAYARRRRRAPRQSPPARSPPSRAAARRWRRAGAADDHRLVIHRRHVSAPASGTRPVRIAICGMPWAACAWLKKMRRSGRRREHLARRRGPPRRPSQRDGSAQQHRRPPGRAVLLHREREVQPPLTVASFATITQLPSLDDPDARDDASAWRLVVVDLHAADAFALEERRARVDEPVDALAREQLSARVVPLDGALPTAGRDERRAPRASSSTSCSRSDWRRAKSGVRSTRLRGVPWREPTLRSGGPQGDATRHTGSDRRRGRG